MKADQPVRFTETLGTHADQASRSFEPEQVHAGDAGRYIGRSPHQTGDWHLIAVFVGGRDLVVQAMPHHYEAA